MTPDIVLISIPANAKPWLNPIPNLNSVKLCKTGGVASAWLKSVIETVIAHKMHQIPFSLELFVAFWHLQHLSKRQPK